MIDTVQKEEDIDFFPGLPVVKVWYSNPRTRVACKKLDVVLGTIVEVGTCSQCKMADKVVRKSKLDKKQVHFC